MGLLDFLFRAASTTVSTAGDIMQHQKDSFDSGYDRGANKASRMSDEELSSALKRAQKDGFSGIDDAGRVRAMADEYKRRNN